MRTLALAICLILTGPYAVPARSQMLTNVGYINIDRLMGIYIERFFDREIEWREDYILEIGGRSSVFMSQNREEKLNLKIQEHRRYLEYLKYHRDYWRTNGQLTDSSLRNSLYSAIKQAIHNTAISEGVSIIISNSGNFVYGSEEVDLTAKVLFRLESSLIDQQQ